MLSGGEKAYCGALLALKRKDWLTALEQFEIAAPFFGEDKEFKLYLETTRLLVKVKETLADDETADKIDIEEVFSNG